MRESEVKRSFFVAEPGENLTPHCDEAWVKWEVGEWGSQRRVCLTSSKRNAQEVASALTFYHNRKTK